MRFEIKKGFSIIESMIYIFLSTIILVEGINIFMPMYKNYLEIRSQSIRYNEYQDFYMNLNNIISEGEIDNIIAGEDYITLCKNKTADNLRKTIRVYDKKIIIVYSQENSILTYNNMLFNVEKIEVNKKNKVIYLKIYDENGENFICCI